MTRMARFTAFAALSILTLVSASACAQAGFPQPVRLAPGLFSLQGMDAASGTEFLRLFLTAESVANAQGPQASPNFIVECTQLHNRRTLLFYVNFGGVKDIGFTPPFKRTPAHPHPPKYPSVALKMIFEGYIHSKPFKRFWEQLPNGNYEYRNPGLHSANLDGPRYFLQYLNSLPVLHIIDPRPEPGKPSDLFFQTAGLLQQVSRAPLCQP